MNTIEQLETKIREAEQLLAAKENRLAEDPSNFARQLTLSSTEAHLDDLHEQLRLAKEERAKEIVELRFMGEPASFGTMPLHLVGDLLKYLADSIHATSYHLRNGKELRGRVPADIIELLDLRMAGLASGSTRVLVSGTLSPDLFGNSLLESSLESTFDVLQAGTDDEFMEAVSHIGKRSANKLREFLKDLSQADLEVEMSWDTPRSETLKWQGKKHSIRNLRNSLNEISVEEETIEVEGQLVMLSKRGRLELEDEEGNIYSCSFPSRLLEVVRPFHIGDHVFARISAETYIYEATQARRTSYQLLTLRDPEAFRQKGLM